MVKMLVNIALDQHPAPSLLVLLMKTTLFLIIQTLENVLICKSLNFDTCWLFTQILDRFAPGTNIKSIWSTSSTATHTLTGTSMAAPRMYIFIIYQYYRHTHIYQMLLAPWLSFSLKPTIPLLNYRATSRKFLHLCLRISPSTILDHSTMRIKQCLIIPSTLATRSKTVWAKRHWSTFFSVTQMTALHFGSMDNH